MTSEETTVRFSGRRFGVRYRLAGFEREAREKAETLRFDQTVELPASLVEPGVVRDEVVGRIEEFVARRHDRYETVVSFAEELLEPGLTRLLNLMFGISSLRAGIRVLRLELPDDVLERWKGPRFGRSGLRDLLGVWDRPLVCGVLKPLGLSVRELADLAHRFALGGLDLVKDDQGLGNHVFCRFEERAARCVEAIAKGSRETGRRCLYVPHVTGPWAEMRQRCLLAKQLGADGVLVCPGLVGFDAMRGLAEDESLSLSIISHPDFLGAYMFPAEHGIAPSVLFGQLPRLAGADATIYPNYESGFPIDRADCRAIADETGIAWGRLKPCFPTAAGRITEERIKAACDFYRRDVILVVGGGFLGSPSAVRRSCQAFMDQVVRCARQA